MSTPQAVNIKPGEKFENLPRAPIVEAVIEIRARPAEALEEASLRSTIEPNLAGYVFLDSLREFQGELKFEGGNVSSQRVQDAGWKGVRFRSSDGKHIAQFNRDGFVFNRLEPYLSWEELENESGDFGTFIKIWPNRSISNVLGSVLSIGSSCHLENYFLRTIFSRRHRRPTIWNCLSLDSCIRTRWPCPAIHMPLM